MFLNKLLMVLGKIVWKSPSDKNITLYIQIVTKLLWNILAVSNFIIIDNENDLIYEFDETIYQTFHVAWKRNVETHLLLIAGLILSCVASLSEILIAGSFSISNFLIVLK